MNDGSVLRLNNVSVALRRGRGDMVPLLDQICLTVNQGEMTALVGESGSGKTLTSSAIIRLLPRNARVSGQIWLGNTDLLRLPHGEMRKIRGRDIGMVFQNPLAALNPSVRVGAQIREAYRLHTGESDHAAWVRACELFDEVGIANARERLGDYPHQFSGGMRQRAMIAMALACSPKLLIADEPTSGLDAILTRQILSLLTRLRHEFRMGVLFITHDLSIVQKYADQVHVLYAGRSVEWGSSEAFFNAPRHPYSRALLGALPGPGQIRLTAISGALPDPEAMPLGCRFAPRCAYHKAECDWCYPKIDNKGTTSVACGRVEDIVSVHPPKGMPSPQYFRSANDGAVILKIEGLGVDYRLPARGILTALTGGKNSIRVLDDIDLTLRYGECLGIVGESGSGKSTLGRAILQMVPYDGSVIVDGIAFGRMTRSRRKMMRRRIQVVFQDPRESLNPRMRIGDIVAEPLRLAGEREYREQVRRLLDRVGLHARILDKFPHAISGGQAQRVAIARALAAKPAVIVLDEPTSSLDVSTQAALLNLLKDLGHQDGLSYILISHDVAAISYIADTIAVLRSGRLIEVGATAALLAVPGAEYTRQLLAASFLYGKKGTVQLAVAPNSGSMGIPS